MAARIRDLPGIVNRNEVFNVEPAKIIVRGGWNPRTDFSGEDDLVSSIAQNGVIVPLRVKRAQDDQIILIDGERRLRATLRAISEGHGIKSLPCIFERQNISDPEAMVVSLLTNAGKPLDPVEESEAFSRLANWGLTQQDIATKIGKSVSYVAQRLELRDASPELKQAVQDDAVSLKTARDIVSQCNGDPSVMREKLKAAKPKGERAPRRAPVDKIMDSVRKLKPHDYDELLRRLKLLYKPKMNFPYPSPDFENVPQGLYDCCGRIES